MNTFDLQKEIESMTTAGMVQLSEHDLLQELDRLGYAIHYGNSFNYLNTGNANKYPARSVYIVEKGTSRSFAHVDARRDENFKALQALRFNTFTVVDNRLWEL